MVNSKYYIALTNSPLMALLRHMNMKREIYIFLIMLGYSAATLSCSPIVPSIVPPITRDGEFTYIYPPTEMERFVAAFERSKNIGIASLYMDDHDAITKNAQTELRVIRGWGKPYGEVIKLIRESSNCGDPEELELGEWYVVVFSEYSDPILMKYKLVKGYIDSMGPHSYAYTQIGIVPK